MPLFVSCLLKRLVFDSLDLFFMTDDGAYFIFAVGANIIHPGWVCSKLKYLCWGWNLSTVTLVSTVNTLLSVACNNWIMTIVIDCMTSDLATMPILVMHDDEGNDNQKGSIDGYCTGFDSDDDNNNNEYLYIIGRLCLSVCLSRKMITLPNNLKSSSLAVTLSFFEYCNKKMLSINCTC